MNQGRIWCVVHPTVGLPLLIGSVAVTSLIVHTAILTHSSWYGPYVGANGRSKTAMNDGDSKVADAATPAPAFTVSVTPTTNGSGAVAYTVTVSPNPAAVADAGASPGAPAVVASVK